MEILRCTVFEKNTYLFFPPKVGISPSPVTHRHPAPPASILSFLFKSLSKSPQAPDVVLANFPYELLVLKTKEVEKVGCTASDSKDF